MDYKPVFRRLLICVVISVVAVFTISEVAFLFQEDRVDRGPQTIELEIPAGASALVAEGLAPPSIPDQMTFVLGDELVVVNHDEVDHQLGPIWVPPGGSASLRLGEVEHVAFACSFQPTQYLGIRVKEPTTITTRLLALLLAGPPLAGVLFVYSLAAYPLVLKKKSEADAPKAENPDSRAGSPRLAENSTAEAAADQAR